MCSCPVKIIVVNLAWLLILVGLASASGPVAVSPGELRETVLISENCPTFSWTSVDSAAAYELVAWRLADGAEGSAEPQVVIEQKLPRGAQGWTPALGRCLQRGERFAWTVRAVDAEGTGEWSEPALFRVAEAPTVAELQEALAIVRRYVETTEGMASLPVPEARGNPPEAVGSGNRSVANPVTRALDTAPAAFHAEPPATTGEVVGVRGVVNSPDGAAGVFNNTAGGKILSGLASGVETISVNSGGDVVANSFSGSGASLTSLDPANLSGPVAIANGGTGASTASAARSNLGAAGSFSELTGTLANGQLSGTYSGTVTLSNASNSFSGDGSGLTGVTSADPTKVSKTGDTMTGQLTLTPGAGNALVANSDINLATGSLFKGGTLFLHNIGTGNTAVGSLALSASTGGSNTAVGRDALRASSSGSNNTAVGSDALEDNTGFDNTAMGQQALSNNTNGGDNTAFGKEALRANQTGNDNTAIGEEALEGSTGDGNIALGENAGSNLTTGDGNIYLGSPGINGESYTLRIGDVIDRAFINGIRGVTTGISGAVTVLVDSVGQLGTASSSRRLKNEIRDMGELSSRLLQLRPVSFRYKQCAGIEESTMTCSGPEEYGLIAEEVEGVFPELVAYDLEGRPETVRYHLLSSLLLNELQKQHRVVEELSIELEELSRLVRVPEPSR